MLKAQIFQVEEHFRGADYNDHTEITATAGGKGVVSHAGSRLLVDIADRTLTGQPDEMLARVRKSRARHDPGRVGSGPGRHGGRGR